VVLEGAGGFGGCVVVEGGWEVGGLVVGVGVWGGGEGGVEVAEAAG
jgi:hypothetical protein